MSYNSYGDDDDEVTYIDMEPPEKRKSKKVGEKEQRRKAIPVLPAPPRYNPDEMMDLRGGITKLDEAIVNLRVDNVPFEEIARMLNLPSAQAAYERMVRTLAKTHPREDWETTRALEVARAEQLLRRSMAMAAAEFFVDAENPDELIPNEDRLRWHQQAASDLALHATITGAKAPTRVEITPTDQEYEALVAEVLRARGHVEPKEYDILALDQIPDIEDAEIVEGEQE